MTRDRISPQKILDRLRKIDWWTCSDHGLIRCNTHVVVDHDWIEHLQHRFVTTVQETSQGLYSPRLNCLEGPNPRCCILLNHD
ncbi:predicted protein [Lichtheimia corymbifera JMRC:FSU:9682]|uniref:Uncharacterized protein n=1 Tax=Lichtheimia corymbifera JMRC:FSU:9682 TaxID=1263082 RepID=A0A068S6W6_9FUNG|nr:predicted protein [Lichtheimia corymbifera JMRC:FSU:9682]